MYRPYRKHALRKVPKELVCHQCGRLFNVRSFTPEAPCPCCHKKHEVRTGKPTPYGKIKYRKEGKLVEIPKWMYVSFKNDPQAFGFEIGLKAIPLYINPYDVFSKVSTAAICKLYMEGRQLGEYERRKKYG